MTPEHIPGWFAMAMWEMTSLGSRRSEYWPWAFNRMFRLENGAFNRMFYIANGVCVLKPEVLRKVNERKRRSG